MTVVAPVHVRHCVTGMRVGCLVIMVAHVVHLKPISTGAFILRRKVRVLQHRAGNGARSSPQQALVESTSASSHRSERTLLRWTTLGARRIRGSGGPDFRSISDVAGLMRIGRLSRGPILVRSDSLREDGTAKEHRPMLSHSIYLPTGVILVTVIVFPSVATSPVNWTFAPAFAASAARF